MDFSLRRTHGIDAALKAARASFIGGCTSTSNTLAGKLYEIPIVGTMAHSFISSFEREIDAFRSFVTSFPENSTLLIDTYDTLVGARRAVTIAHEMAAKGQRLRGVRIDSGDLLHLAREVRRIFDEAGLSDVKIVGSGGLDENDLEELTAAGAPCDLYGVGTRLGVSADAPWSDMAYKLVDYNGRPVLKLSTGKVSMPGRKQIFRSAERKGQLKGDVLGLREERHQGAKPLLINAMENGRRLGSPASLKEIRAKFLEEFRHLDDGYKSLRNPAHYPVKLSPRLKRLQEEIQTQISRTQLND